MVNSVILSCSLKGGNVLGSFNNADNAAVPFIVSADRADVPFGQILTALTFFFASRRAFAKSSTAASSIDITW